MVDLIVTTYGCGSNCQSTGPRTCLEGGHVEACRWPRNLCPRVTVGFKGVWRSLAFLGWDLISSQASQYPQAKLLIASTSIYAQTP